MLNVFPSAIEVEHPYERSLSCNAHEPSSFQHRSHVFRRVNKSPKGVASQPPPEVLERRQGPHVPTIAGIGERQHSARSRGCPSKQRRRIRVAADNTVECHYVGIGQGICDHGKVAEEELGGT